VNRRAAVFCASLILLITAAGPAAAVGEWEIQVNIPAFSLTVLRAGEMYGEYPIAVGRPGNETPTGKFSLVRKVKNPVWYPPRGGAPVRPGPANPLGYRWLEYRTPGYGIHGNNNPHSIGQAVSLGCIRLRNSDVEMLYDLLPVGTPVHIVYETVVVTNDAAAGETRVLVYPDIYGKGTTTAAVLREKLAAAGYPAMREEELDSLLAAAAAAPVLLPGRIAVEIGGRVIADDAFVAGGLLFVPLRPLCESVGMPLVWDGVRDRLLVGEREVSALHRSGRAYLSLEQAELLLGLRGTWSDESPAVAFRAAG
jgi:L,D-transpeptidase ErfK/SrfK